MALKNTLLIGNGFSQTLFRNVPSWSSLFGSVAKQNKPNLSFSNATFLYEAYLIRDNYSDEALKRTLIEQIKAAIPSSSDSFVSVINNSIEGISDFGKYLAENNISNIITTNFDKGIELLLVNKCGYTELQPVKEDLRHAETIYSLRRKYVFFNPTLSHNVTVWKMHGDIENIKTVSLGFDQYSGSLAKLNEYVKGTYSSSSKGGPSCQESIFSKLRSQRFDSLSWAELFFTTNVFILGLGMAFSELDLWWLINKRARFIKDGAPIKNSICYLKNIKYDTEEINTNDSPELKKQKQERHDIFSALEIMGVDFCNITSDSNYMRNVFECIHNYLHLDHSYDNYFVTKASSNSSLLPV